MHKKLINAIYLPSNENPFHVWDDEVDMVCVPCATPNAPASSLVTGVFLGHILQ